MYAVQQIYALRYHRFEIQPDLDGHDERPVRQPPRPGLALNYYITNVLAVGVSGDYYFNSDSDFNSRRAARPASPCRSPSTSGRRALNFTYVPMYGKFAGFSDFIFHYDVYVVGGVGAISTRPIAVIDPDNRSFEWDEPQGRLQRRHRPAHLLQPLVRRRRSRSATTSSSTSSRTPRSCRSQRRPPTRRPGTAEHEAHNNVQAQVGVSIFLPFSWEYRLPK